METVVTVEGVEYVVKIDDEVLFLRPADGRGMPRVIPWQSVIDLPVAWGVVADGYLAGKYPTERLALDRATDMRANGVTAIVIKIPLEASTGG